MTFERTGHAIRLPRDERGAASVLIAITAVALMAAVALAVDVGMLLNSRSEAQRAADSAALAGAASLIIEPNKEDRARQIAIEYGEMNSVHNEAAVVLEEDVDVDLANRLVRVRVRRTADRGSAVGTWFARIFGVDEVDIAAVAAAQVQPAGRAKCVKPFAIPDRFRDVNGNGEWDEGIDEYDPEKYGYGTSWRNPGEGGYEGGTHINDLGRPIELFEGGPGVAKSESWYRPWDMPVPGDQSATGGNRYRDNIRNCNASLIAVGKTYHTETGAMEGPTGQGSNDLINQDKDAYWDDVTNTVAGSAWGDAWEGSPRVAIIPTHHPGWAYNNGKQPIEFTNFIGVFVTEVTGGGNKQRVHGRILFPMGVVGGSGPPAANLSGVRLVE